MDNTAKRPKGRPRIRRKSSSSTDSLSDIATNSQNMPNSKKKKRSAGISGTRRDGVMIVKGNWTDGEDQYLSKLVLSHNIDTDQKSGNNTRWSEIAKHLPGRVGKQCRERWHNHLRPDINKGRWSFAEEVIIYICWRSWTSQWARISRLLEGRSDNRVKNHWNCHMKRRLQRDRSYAEFLETAAGNLKYLLRHNYSDDETEVYQLRSELVPRVDEYLVENRAVLDRLPFFSVAKRDAKNLLDKQQPTPVLHQQVKLLLENTDRPSRKLKSAKKKKQTRKQPTPTSFVNTDWVQQAAQAQTDVENQSVFMTPDHFGRLGGVLYRRLDGFNPDMEVSNENAAEVSVVVEQPDYFYTAHGVQMYGSPSVHYNTEIVLGAEQTLLNGDPMWTRAVTIEYATTSPPPFPRCHATSTPVKSFAVPSASECGTSFVTPTRARKPVYDFHNSPVGRPYFGEEVSLWSPSKLAAFTGKAEEGAIWSPMRQRNGVLIKTPQPIRDAIFEANRSRISPEDLASPSRLFSDASELIEDEMQQSCGSGLRSPAFITSYQTPDLSKCRRRLMDQWTNGQSAHGCSTTFNSSGYMSFAGTPSSGADD